jgi:hypothetical protein
MCLRSSSVWVPVLFFSYCSPFLIIFYSGSLTLLFCAKRSLLNVIVCLPFVIVSLVRNALSLSHVFISKFFLQNFKLRKISSFDWIRSPSFDWIRLKSHECVSVCVYVWERKRERERERFLSLASKSICVLFFTI